MKHSGNTNVIFQNCKLGMESSHEQCGTLLHKEIKINTNLTQYDRELDDV